MCARCCLPARIAGLSAVALLAIQAGQMGDGWEDARRLEVWWAVLGTTFGEVWRWHLGLSLLAILSLLLPERLRAQALALCSALLLVSPAFIGHAAMHEGTLGALHRANHAVHLLAAGYWFGCRRRCWFACVTCSRRSGAATPSPR